MTCDPSMAFKQEPKDMDTQSFLGTHSSSLQGASLQCDTPVSSAMGTPHLENFLGEQLGPEVILDPMQEEVVYLPHRAPSGRAHRRRMRGVTEYANYTISHVEAEMNSKHLPKKYRCRFCIYKTSYKSDLNRHLKKHGIALQHCPLCNMPFKTAGNLENHIGQAHSDVVQSISNVQSLPSVLRVKEALSIAGQMSVSPQRSEIHVNNSDAHTSVTDAGRDHDIVQPRTDLPVSSPALQSPLQLHCHMCPFVSSDAQVLARHILTHPGEEEVSRAPVPHSSQQDFTVLRLTCSVCGVILPSVVDLQAHRQSCNCSHNSSQGNQKQRALSLNSENENTSKRNSDGTTDTDTQRLGFPRRETLSKLKISLTNQNFNSTDCLASPSAARPQFLGKKEETSMILPNIPVFGTDSTTAESNHTDHPASLKFSTLQTEKRGESCTRKFSVQKSVSREQSKSLAGSKETSRPRLLSTDVSCLTAQDQTLLTRHPSKPITKLFSSTDSIPYTEKDNGLALKNRNNNDSHLQTSQSRRRQQSSTISSVEKNNESHTAETVQRDISGGANRMPTCADFISAALKSTDTERSKQITQTTVLIKEEPQSPDVVPAELENLETACASESRSYSTSLGSFRNSKNETNKDECDVCGQLFRDPADLVDHVQHVHILSADRSFSSVKTGSNRAGCSFQNTQSAHENSCMVTESHSNHVISNTEKFSEHSPHTHFFNSGVVSHPPSRGRYAVLESNFDDFASKPYACSLCFFRTARLSELSVHVHNHLTGGSIIPTSLTASFQSKGPVLVERGTSPFKTDPEDGLDCEATIISESAISCAIENVTAVRSPYGQNERFQRTTVEQSSFMVPSKDRKETHTDNIDGQTSNSAMTTNKCHPMQTSPVTCSSPKPCSHNHSFRNPEMQSVSANVSISDHESEASLGDHDAENDSKHPNKMCPSRISVDSGEHIQLNKVRSDTEDFRNMPGDSVELNRDILFHNGPEETDNIHTLPVVSKESTENGVTIPISDVCARQNIKRAILQKELQTTQKSSHKQLQLRGPNNKYRRPTRLRVKTRMLKKCVMAKTSFRYCTTKLNRYRCELCEHRFCLKQVLARHTRFFHSTSVSLSTET